ncbi:alternative ribosome rescue factor ArfA [Pelagibius sp. Alg239-R121]|uniref:alternative ribosome rescue factor ArfA n=1 Tax=Pelagibius sp. Alg239-R121 TaxID=2993448 RepID=UPI003460FF77
MKQPPWPRRPNSAAKALADPKHRKRIVRAKRGKGSYTRKGRQVYPGALPICPPRNHAVPALNQIHTERLTFIRN